MREVADNTRVAKDLAERPKLDEGFLIQFQGIWGAPSEPKKAFLTAGLRTSQSGFSRILFQFKLRKLLFIGNDLNLQRRAWLQAKRASIVLSGQ